MRIATLRVMIALIALIAIAASAVTASACSRQSVPGAAKVIRPERGINQALLDRAILSEVNFARCRAGLRPLRSETRLRHAAEGHSKWMARARSVSHVSTVAGQRSLKARMKRTGIKLRAGAENIGMVHRFRLDNTNFLIRDQATCQFTTHSRKQIPAHSYQSLAHTIVAFWMASHGHRANILNRKVTMVGTAAILDPRAEYCGKFYITQDFAG